MNNKYIPPCQTIAIDWRADLTWLDLLEKYIELNDFYKLCKKKVDQYNE